MTNQYNGSQNSRVRNSLHPLGPKIGPTVQSTTAEKTARKNRHQELPAEQMEEAEQDAAG
jgi:hypothetical protein